MIDLLGCCAVVQQSAKSLWWWVAIWMMQFVYFWTFFHIVCPLKIIFCSKIFFIINNCFMLADFMCNLPKNLYFTNYYILMICPLPPLVLSHPETKAIYDIYGQKGLDAGWEVMKYFITVTIIMHLLLTSLPSSSFSL